MKAILLFLLISFEIADKCDFFFVGNVHYRRRGHAIDQDDQGVIEGCKKGCFWNETYTDDGVPKCEKCKEIKDEIECLSHTATCQWTKSGKCKAQSCPNIAKSRVTLRVGSDGTFAHIVDNSTTESQYRDQVRKETECIEGSALEQKYNNLYWSDYNSTYNYQYAVWNVDDTCRNPGTTVATGVYGWTSVRTNNAAANRAACGRFLGYVYTANANTPTANPELDECRQCYVETFATAGPQAHENECRNIGGCRFIRGTSTDGTGFDGTGDADQCVIMNSGFCGSGWTPGINTSADCTRNAGCVYIKGAGGRFRTVSGTRVRDDFIEANGLSSQDQCVAGCGTSFVAGTSTRKDCEVLGCTYTGSDSETRVGTNLTTFEVFDTCPAAYHYPARGDLGAVCGVNSTLAINNANYPNACDDRTYDPARAYFCSIEAITTEEACKNGHGTWTAPTKNCRELFNIVQSRCEFNIRDAKDQIVYVNLSHHGGNLKPGTKYEACVQNHYDELDTLQVENVTTYTGENVTVRKYLSPGDDHERIYGYRTPEEYCKHQEDLRVEIDCQRPFETSVAGCHTKVKENQVTADDLISNSIGVKASRSACHRIYGCMYSKSNERCSVWAVWAFIFTIVLMTVVVVAVLGVGVVFILPKLKGSSA